MLVELDSSELQKQIIQQEIQYQSAVASLTDAQQGYDIQMNQNISDIKAAEQKARFARMDFDKFLGDTVTDEIIDQLGLEKELAAESTNHMAGAASETPPTLTVPPHSGLVVAQGAEGRPGRRRGALRAIRVLGAATAGLRTALQIREARQCAGCRRQTKNQRATRVHSD